MNIIYVTYAAVPGPLNFPFGEAVGGAALVILGLAALQVGAAMGIPKALRRLRRRLQPTRVGLRSEVTAEA